ncbi:ATP-binding protein [Halobacillus salinus]|uniref:ATP-binding protein n=1 Tax=Halobacillus salinus TaxID=192814 RepID=A0A4Z0H6C0_9BACI|nr:ATP-binding protein [Halobacillus salinus]TGB05374.1 ATP-binding protein [Halobacillus salinus]
MSATYVRYINNPKEIKEMRKDYFPHLLKEFGSDQLLVEASISEAVVNAWKHGNDQLEDKKVRVQISFLKTRMIVRVLDEGDGFDWRQYSRPYDVKHWFPDMDHLEEKGRGIILLLRVMDHLRYNEKGNECLLMKKYQNQG